MTLARSAFLVLFQESNMIFIDPFRALFYEKLETVSKIGWV
jgi:hypothetical protein